MKKKFKPIPRFKTEKEEREFWWTHDTTDYIDWSKAELAVFPNLKLTTKEEFEKAKNKPSSWRP